jgi:methyl-accepting chemotaxis protein
MKNWKIGTQISGGFALILLSMIVLTAVGMLQVNKINNSLTLINDVNGVKERYAINFRGSVHDRAIAVRDVTLVPASELPALLSHIAQLEEAYRASAGPLDAIFAAGANVSDDEKSALERLKAAESKAVPLLHEVIDKQQAGATGAAKTEVLDQARPAFVEWLAACNGLINMEEGMNHVQAIKARSVGVNFQLLMLTLTLIAMALGITIALKTSSSIKYAIGGEPADVKRITDAIGEGDLSAVLHLRDGDTDSILASLSRMQEALRSTLQEVTETAINASSTSQELSVAAAAIASGADKQASSLEETSASLEEITATIRQSADNARQASQLASTSKESAENGQGVVANAITAMEEINASSAKISDIISTIDEIAFQTNLLAVNAAVEAARAGEQGRGFAVVASEVRSLAQRSAGAAKEIKTLIQDSLRKVEKGSELVNRSGATLQSLVGSVKRVTDIVGEMAAATEEQSTGVEQVNLAVTQIDQVTQSNSAQTEELSSTAQSLSDQSAHLLKLVSIFTLEQGGKERMSRQEPTRQRVSAVQPRSRPVKRPTALARKPASRVDLHVQRSDLKVPVSLLTPHPRGKAAADSSFEEF